jgi:preprotein translocase subunit YajC
LAVPYFLLAQAADAAGSDPNRSFLDTVRALVGGPNSTFFLISIVFAIFYVMIIRPQQKTQRKLEAFLAGLKKGDEVVTTGGLIGRIQLVSGEVLMLEVANNVRIRVLKTQVTGPFVPKEEKPVEKTDKLAAADKSDGAEAKK